MIPKNFAPAAASLLLWDCVYRSSRYRGTENFRAAARFPSIMSQYEAGLQELTVP